MEKKSFDMMNIAEVQSFAKAFLATHSPLSHSVDQYAKQPLWRAHRASGDRLPQYLAHRGHRSEASSASRGAVRVENLCTLISYKY